MGFILAAFAFLYAYMSFQDGKMLHVYIAVLIGIVLIALMINNIFKVRKMLKESQKNSKN